MPNSSTRTRKTFAAIKCPSSWTTIRNTSIPTTSSTVSILLLVAHFLLLRLERLLQLFVRFVRMLLKFLAKTKFIVFCQFAVTLLRFNILFRLIARNSNCTPSFLELHLRELYKLFAPFGRKLRERDADGGAVGRSAHAQISARDGALNVLEKCRIKGLNAKRPRVFDADMGHLF